MEGENQVGIEFVLQHVEDMPWTELNVVTQTRKTYQSEGLEELKNAIRATDTPEQNGYKLFHPLMVNLLDKEMAGQYLADLNLCHGTNHTLDELQPREDGSYVIVIAGHRRRLATGEIIEELGADASISTVPCSVYENLSFSEALRKQIDENTHQSLSVTEVARAIQSTYKFGVATGKYGSVADCVRDLPFGNDKVRNALKFCELPGFLQVWVEDERLPYGAAVALHPLMTGLREQYSKKSELEREAIVNEYMMAYGLKIISNRWGRDMVAEQVNSITSTWLSGAEALQLFQVDELKEAKKFRQRATRELLGNGINLIRNFKAIAMGRLYDELPLEQREALIAEVSGLLKELGGTALRDKQSDLELFEVS